MSLNKVMLIGNVGRDPEVRYLENSGNAKVATFTLATTERYRDRNGEMRENTEWHNIVAWRNSADVVERFVKKGTQLYVEGRLRTRSWDDQTGNKRYTTEILVDNLQLLGKKADTPRHRADSSRHSLTEADRGTSSTASRHTISSLSSRHLPLCRQPRPMTFRKTTCHSSPKVNS